MSSPDANPSLSTDPYQGHGKPRITVAVIVVGDVAHLERCLRHLMPQTVDLPIDVLVPCDDALGDVSVVRSEFPAARFLNLGRIAIDSPGSAAARHELFDKRVSAALAASRGSHVALLQDWGIPAPDWCRQLMKAVELPHAAVGGAVENLGQGALNWAVYFLEFGRHQLPLSTGPSEYLSDVNLVYRRADIEEVRETWGQRYNEAIVHWALRDRGKLLWRMPQMIVQHDRGRLSLWPLLAERLSWGRLFGAVRAHELGFPKILPYLVLGPLIPFAITRRAAAKVFGGGRNRLRFFKCLPAFFLLATAWSLGEMVGYATRRPAPQRNEKESEAGLDSSSA